MRRDVRIERRLAHPPERVWRALTDAAALGAWFMPNDLEPTLGRAFTFRMKPQRGWDGVTHCEVIELEPERRIAFTYRGRATGEKTLACAGVASDTALSAGKGVFTELDTVLRFSSSPRTAARAFEGLKLVLVSFVMGVWGGSGACSQAPARA